MPFKQALLGDNFYDRDGRLTTAFYDGISLEAKSKILMTVSGNHDLWVYGKPQYGEELDQYGHGFMQWYAQDTVASVESPNGFLDFSVPVDDRKDSKKFRDRNSGRNFVWYTKIGSVGFIGFNGAAPTDDESRYFAEACEYFKGNVQSAFVLGHWDNSYERDIAIGTPDVRKKISRLSGCSELGHDLRYMDGHKHLNYIQEKSYHGHPVGFKIGGHGMENGKAGTEVFGFLYVKSYGKGGQNDEVWYFEEINKKYGKDNYQEILDCVNRGRVDDCTHLAERWL